MKYFYCSLLFLFCSGGIIAQNIITLSPGDYQIMKDNRTLDPAAFYVLSADTTRSMDHSTNRIAPHVTPQAAVCNCMVPLDTTFQVAPFTIGILPDYRNDDGSTAAIAIPFQFNFFGTLYGTLYINNNGNISFGAPYGTFTSSGFPNAQFKMIAPFWADVDTRNLSSGLVYYKITPTHIIVRWDSVGYYANYADKRNTFQLIISDGTDTILPPNTNVSFCYGDMQWTTGDASGGVNGFGGNPATIGVNEGNGVDYFQVTQSVDSTSSFDGPYNNPDGVNWLDELEVTFNTALTGNVPPLVMNNTICDTIDVYTGDTIRISAIDSITFDFFITTPEPGQTITSAITTNAPGAQLTVVQTMNLTNTHAYHCIFDARNLSPGFYYVTASGTDNGSPSMQASASVYIQTYYDSALTVSGIIPESNIKVYPNPVGEFVNVHHGPEVTSIILSDVNGCIITTQNVTGDVTVLETRQLASGVYFIRVMNADGSVSVARFVK